MTQYRTRTSPRTAKQKAAIKRYNTSLQTGLVIIGATAVRPTSSWWVSLSREEFDQAVAREAPRMRGASASRPSKGAP